MLAVTGILAEQGHPLSRLEDVALSTIWVLTHTTLLARNIFVVVLFFVLRQCLRCIRWLQVFCVAEDDLGLPILLLSAPKC